MDTINQIHRGILPLPDVLDDRDMSLQYTYGPPAPLGDNGAGGAADAEDSDGSAADSAAADAHGRGAPSAADSCGRLDLFPGSSV